MIITFQVLNPPLPKFLDPPLYSMSYWELKNPNVAGIDAIMNGGTL
jgi:hypothetical protein